MYIKSNIYLKSIPRKRRHRKTNKDLEQDNMEI